MKKKHYDTLGVDKGASQADIKRAYRKKAKKTHPDIPGNDPAEFSAVSEAYKILIDPVKRERYDNGEDVDSNLSREDQIAQAAKSLFIGIFQDILFHNNPDILTRRDIINITREQINSSLSNKQKDISIIKDRRDTLTNLKDNLIYTGDKHSFLHDMMDHQIDMYNRQLQALYEDIDIHEEALVLTDSYVWLYKEGVDLDRRQQQTPGRWKLSTA